MVAPFHLFDNSGWDVGWRSCGGGQTCQASSVLWGLLIWLLPLSEYLLRLQWRATASFQRLEPISWAQLISSVWIPAAFVKRQSSSAGLRTQAFVRISNSKEHIGPGTGTSSPLPSLVKGHARGAKQWLREQCKAGEGGDSGFWAVCG